MLLHFICTPSDSILCYCWSAVLWMSLCTLMDGFRCDFAVWQIVVDVTVCRRDELLSMSRTALWQKCCCWWWWWWCCSVLYVVPVHNMSVAVSDMLFHCTLYCYSVQRDVQYINVVYNLSLQCTFCCGSVLHIVTVYIMLLQRTPECTLLFRCTSCCCRLLIDKKKHYSSKYLLLVCLSVRLSACLCVCLYMYVCLSVSLTVCMCVCASVGVYLISQHTGCLRIDLFINIRLPCADTRMCVLNYYQLTK